MKVTGKLRQEIRAVVKRCVGSGMKTEIGLRGERWLPNALKWTDDDDLGDLQTLRSLVEIDDDEANPGCALLDLYVYSSRELETNVYAFIRDGHVVGATQHEREVEPLRQSLRFPQTRGW